MEQEPAVRDCSEDAAWPRVAAALASPVLSPVVARSGAGDTGSPANLNGVETYSTAEAARLTDITVRALRKRIERGTLRAVRRDDGWRIPRSELERAGLRIGPAAEPGELVRELTDTIRRQERELTQLRALPQRVADQARRLDVEQAARATAERQAQAAAAQRAELAAELDELAAAGPIRAWRLRRELRQAAASA